MSAQSRVVLAGVVCLALALGLARYPSARIDDTPLYALALEKADVVITGYMDGGLKRSSAGWSLYVHAVSAEGKPVRERLLVRLATEPRWKFGDGMQLSGRIGRAAAFDDFDYPAYLRKEGVRAVMIHPAVEDTALHLTITRSAWMKTVRAIYDVRDVFTASVRRAVPEPAASYLVGVLVGGRAALPQDIVDQFSRTSTSHVLAISGYNITILAVAVMTLLAGRIGKRRAMCITIAVIAVFVIMTGASASVVRAALMGVLVLAAGALGRQVHTGTVMLVSAVAMVAYNPLILRDDVGFQMSFAALCGIVYLEPIISGYLGKIGKHIVARIIAATTAAQLAVLPLILFYFHTLSVIGPLTNVLVLPLVPLAMALGFATGLAGLLVPALGHAVGLLAWVVAEYQLLAVRYTAALPWSSFTLFINGAIVASLYGILMIWWHLEKKPVLPYDTTHD